MTEAMTIGPGFDDILAAAQTGADWAIAVLYREMQPALLRYLEGRAPGHAEDLASEVWLAITPKLASFEGNEAGFRGWLFTIARRRVIDHARRAIRRQTDPVDDAEFNRRAASNDTAADGIEAISTQEAVRALTAGLPSDQADVILLRVVAGLDVGQVAKIMGRTPGSVRVLQHRALRRVAKHLI